MAKKKTTEWPEATDLFERMMYLRGALSEIARVEVPTDVRAEPRTAGAEMDGQLIAGARSRVLALMEERRMLRLAVRELDACTWTWGQLPAGTDGPEDSWDLIQAARESVATARKYQIGDAERPEVAALRRELAEVRASADTSALLAAEWKSVFNETGAALDSVGAPAIELMGKRILWLVRAYEDVSRSLDLAANENLAVIKALDAVHTPEPDHYEDGGYPDAVERIRDLSADRLAQSRAAVALRAALREIECGEIPSDVGAIPYGAAKPGDVDAALIADARRWVLGVVEERDRLTADLAQARTERDTLFHAVQWATAGDDALEGGPATTVPDLVARLKRRIGRLVETHEAALNELLTTAFAARRAFRGTDRLPNTDEGSLHAARDQDDHRALGSKIRSDIGGVSAMLTGTRDALGRIYLFARAGASLSGSGEDKIDRMTSGEAFDVARGALLAIVAESRTWRAGR